MKTSKAFKVIMVLVEKSNREGDIVMSPDGKRLATLNCLTVDSEQPCTNQHLYIISDDEIKLPEGTWVWNDESNEIYKTENVGYEQKNTTDRIFKIIATTDILKLKIQSFEFGSPQNEEFLPQIPESFINAYIKAYNEGKPITEVDLEVEEMVVTTREHLLTGSDEWNRALANPVLRIKTHPNNTVIVHEIEKELYTKEDVHQFIRNYDTFVYEKGGFYFPNFLRDKWIEENL